MMAMEYVGWTRMEDGTKADFELIERHENAAASDLSQRVLGHLALMDVDWGGYRVTRFQHSLQSATLALRDGAEDELVVAALLHDIGDVIAPYNHAALAAAMLKPYVSDKTHWIIEQHGVFQGYYFHHHLGGDRNAREQFRDHPYFEDCAYFCSRYDQCAFDPDYDTLPLATFEPLVHRLFERSTAAHLEVTPTP